MHNTEEKQGYKFTEEFGYIPEDWDIKGFKDTFTKYATNSFTREDMSDTDGFIKNIHYGDILVEYGAILDCSCEKIPYINREITKSYKKVNNGDIVLADTAEDETVGKCIEVYNIQDDEVILAGMHTMHLRPNFKFASKFLGYFLNSNVYHNQLMQYVTGIKVSSISKSDINKTYILKPPFPEQEKIAEVLSDIDELIESTQKLIDKKKDLKTATMQKLLTPKPHWVAKKLGEIVKLQGGYSFSSTNFKNVGIPIVRISNIYNNLVILEDDIVYHDEIDLSSCFIINKNDILIAMSGATTGKIGLYYYDNIAYLNQRVGKFIIIDETITNKLFLLQLLKDWKFETLLKKEIAQGAQPNVSSAQIEKMEFMVPISYTEQQKIAQTLSDMDAEIEALEKELNKYKDLKTGMMQELLTGKKRLV